jgi:hypothetical protein
MIKLRQFYSDDFNTVGYYTYLACHLTLCDVSVDVLEANGKPKWQSLKR